MQKKILFCLVLGSRNTPAPPFPLSASTTLISPSYAVLQSSRSLQTPFAWVNLLSLNFGMSVGESGGSAWKAKDKRDSPTAQRMSQKYPAVPSACQGLQDRGARAASPAPAPGAPAPGATVPAASSTISARETLFLLPLSFLGLPKHLAVGFILHLYWNSVPSGAEHCSCLIAHSIITQADGKESEMCKKRSFHFPSNPFFLSSLSTAICANSRQLQMCVFPTSICRDLALETGICLPTYCLPMLSAPRVEFLLPHSSLAVLPDMLWDGGQTCW